MYAALIAAFLPAKMKHSEESKDTDALLAELKLNLDDGGSISDSNLLEHSTVRPKLQSRSHFFYPFIALLLAYVPVLILSIKTYIDHRQSKPPNIDIFPSLAEAGIVRWERKNFAIDIHNNPFAGEPRPELDAAWHGLFEHDLFAASAEDLAFHNVSSIPLVPSSPTEPTRYAVQLDVVHELHCLKKIRQSLYPDYYYPNETAAEYKERIAHNHHCVELLREVLMCKSDLSLTTLLWVHDPPQITSVNRGHHQCLNFEDIQAWSRERAIQVWDDGVLVKPGEEDEEVN